MKKIKIFKATGLLVIIISSGIILSGCTKNSSETTAENGESNTSVSTQAESNVKDVMPGEPYLKMSIVDYPKIITDFCQTVSFTIEVENVGDTSLKYEDFEDTYFLSIVSDDAISSYDNTSNIDVVDVTNYNDDEGLITYQTTLSNFGEIMPGEKSTITFTSKNYVINDQHEYYWVNGFKKVINGSYNYYIIFGKLSEEETMFAVDTEISRSSTVDITTEGMDSESGWKYCHYEIITDQSIDFNE